MSAEENKAIVRRYVDAFNDQNAQAFDELASPDMAQEARETLEWVYATFEGHHIDIIGMLAEGEQVWIRVATSGGHSGEWQGIAPTGKQWTNTGVGWYRLADGKIVEEGLLFDGFNHLKQLGGTITPPA